jgi:hypothetical protein
MKILPQFVKAGDSITASEYNKLTRSVRDSKFINPYGDSILAGISNKVNQPFDIIDYTVQPDGRHTIKLKTGYIFQGTDAFNIYTPNTLDGSYASLASIPEIVIPPQLINLDIGWMYVDLEKFEVNFHGESEYDSRAIYIGRFKFKSTEPNGNGQTELTEFDYINLHPSNIVKNTNDQFVVTTWQPHNVEETQSTPPPSCTLTIANGYVWTIDPASGSEVLTKKKVKATGGEYLDATPSPIFEGVEDGQYVYLKVTTNIQGVIEDDPEISIGAEGEANAHYYPKPLDETGVYNYPLAKIRRLEFEGETGTYYQFVAEQLWSGPLIIQADLPTIENVGDHREIYKTYDKTLGQYELRTLEQLEAENSVAIIKPLEEDEDEDDKETVEFRYLTEKASQPQIKIEETTDKKGIRIKGNDYDADVSGGVQSIVVKDGLVTDVVSGGGDGGNLNLTILGFSIITEPPYIQANSYDRVLYWRSGIYVGSTVDYGSTPPPVTNGEALLEEEVARID